MCAECLRDDSPSLLIAQDRSDDPEVQRITVAGEIVGLSGAQLHKAVIDVLGRRPARIEINLRGVIFIDSAGVNALLLCHADAERVNCKLTLIDPHPRTYTVLQIAKLTDHFRFTG
jgi:anti-anti-sigma factor